MVTRVIRLFGVTRGDSVWLGVVLGWIGLFAGCAERSSTDVRVRSATPVVAARPAVAPSTIVWPESAPPIAARSAILIDARTGRTLYQKNADMPVPVASTQKLLTALVVCRNGSLDAPVTIMREDTLVEPVKLYVKSGQRYTRRALLTAMLIESQNDAAAALARDHSGSVTAFAEVMNAEAAALGAFSSRFCNPHGLPGPQFSTARDMARIAFQAYRNPTIRQIVNTEKAPFYYATGRATRLDNTNKLLSRSALFNGMKTGYTIAAGRCLVASASSGGADVILVQLGSRTKFIFDDAETMLRWGLMRAGGTSAPTFAALAP